MGTIVKESFLRSPRSFGSLVCAASACESEELVAITSANRRLHSAPGPEFCQPFGCREILHRSLTASRSWGCPGSVRKIVDIQANRRLSRVIVYRWERIRLEEEFLTTKTKGEQEQIMLVSSPASPNSRFQRALQIATAFALIKLAIQVGANLIAKHGL